MRRWLCLKVAKFTCQPKINMLYLICFIHTCWTIFCPGIWSSYIWPRNSLQTLQKSTNFLHFLFVVVVCCLGKYMNRYSTVYFQKCQTNPLEIMLICSVPDADFKQLTWQRMYGPEKLMEDWPELLPSSTRDRWLLHFQQPSSCSKGFFSLLLFVHSEASEELQGDTEQWVVLSDNSICNLSTYASEEFVFIVSCLEMSSVKHNTMLIRSPSAALCTPMCTHSAPGYNWWQTGSQKYIVIYILHKHKYAEPLCLYTKTRKLFNQNDQFSPWSQTGFCFCLEKELSPPTVLPSYLLKY